MGGSSRERESNGLAKGVVFRLDDRRYALALDCVERVLRMAAWTPVPDAPETVLGVIDVAGRIVPVLDLRRRLGLPPRAPSVAGRMLLVNVAGWRFLAPVDAVEGLVDLAAAKAPPEPLPVGQPVRLVLEDGGEPVLVLEPGELDREGWKPPEAGDGEEEISGPGAGRTAGETQQSRGGRDGR